MIGKIGNTEKALALILSFLFPIAGIVFFIIWFSDNNPEKRRLGKHCLIVSIFLNLLLIFFVVFGVVAYFSVPINTQQSNNQFSKTEVNSEYGEIYGYYFDGYLDRRPRFEDEDYEEEYIKLMKAYFIEYLDSHFIDSSSETSSESDLSYFIDYVESIGSPEIIDLGETNFNNGDYIQVTIKGGIMESFPAQVFIVDMQLVDESN